MNLRDQWFIVALIFVTILALFAPKFAGVLVLLIAVYIAVGPLYDQGFFKRA
jgi:hypothetical protein